MLRSFSIVNWDNGDLKMVCPCPSVDLMNEWTHTDESSSMNVKDYTLWRFGFYFRAKISIFVSKVQDAWYKRSRDILYFLWEVIFLRSVLIINKLEVHLESTIDSDGNSIFLVLLLYHGFEVSDRIFDRIIRKLNFVIFHFFLKVKIWESRNEEMNWVLNGWERHLYESFKLFSLR